jgi:hypothetical protein
VRIIAERCQHSLQLSAALHVDVARTVHENVRDRAVAEERLDWAEADHLVDNLVDDLLALGLRQRCRLAPQQFGNREPDLRRDLALVRDLLERLEIETLDELAVDIPLQLIDRIQNVFIGAPGSEHARRLVIQRCSERLVCGARDGRDRRMFAGTVSIAGRRSGVGSGRAAGESFAEGFCHVAFLE